jgi:tripartite-type tricarboxylate transporter receptor subunit TctC
MTGGRRAGWLGLCAALLFAGGAAADDFYQDRTVKLIISDTGGYDAEARLLARHLPKHIPGHATIVVMNMPGAGGLTGANYVYNIAERDGGTFALFNRNIILTALIGSPQVRFKLGEFNWLGAPADFSNDPYLFIMRAALPFRTPDELRHADPPIIAGAAGSLDILHLLQDALGLSLKIVPGYQKNELDFALERGEVDGQTIGWSNLRARHPEWLDKQIVRPVVQFGRIDRFAPLAAVPTARELARTPEERALIALGEGPLLIAYPFAMPPGAPPERVATMRKAFAETMADPAYREEAVRQQLEITPKTGEEVAEIVGSMLRTPDSVVARYKQIVGGTF